MNYLGIDLHKKNSQICVLNDAGRIVLEQRTPTDAANLVDLLRSYLPGRVLIESSTLTEYIARALEFAGFEVLVVDPNFAPMYATRSSKVKTDKRDARTLADAAVRGTYRLAHRLSDEQRKWRGHLQVRQSLVQSRTRYIAQCRCLLSAQGIAVADGSAECFARRVRQQSSIPAELQAVLLPLLRMMDGLNQEIASLDELLAQQVQRDERARAMETMPSVGPITVMTLISVLDDAGRFQSGRQVAAYLGLVPRENSSGEKQKRGRITKAGAPQARSLLLSVAHSMMRLKSDKTREHWQWAERLLCRRGKKQVAAVALARRLVTILWAMMRDKTAYRPSPKHDFQPTATPQATADSQGKRQTKPRRTLAA